MGYLDRIQKDLTDAMKSKDELRLSVLRMMKTALKNKEIEARGQGKSVSDEDILALLQKMTKSRKESQEIFEKAGRADLATQESEEIAIIQSFLPSQMSHAEVEQAIAAAIAESGATSIKDMGRVIGALKGKYAGRMDFANASALVKRMLGG